jgi:hypothetical protein
LIALLATALAFRVPQGYCGDTLNSFYGIMKPWNEIAGGRLSKLRIVGRKERAVSERGIDRALGAACRIFRRGQAVPAATDYFIREKQWEDNDGGPDSQNYVYMVVLLVQKIAERVFQRRDIAREVAELEMGCGSWWNQAGSLSVHDPRADCIAYWDGFKMEELFEQITGYIKYQSNPLVAPNDLERRGRGITNLSRTCYMATSLQIMAHIPELWPKCIAVNNGIEPATLSDYSRTIRGLTIALAELRYGPQETPVAPNLPYHIMCKANAMSEVTIGFDTAGVSNLMNIICANDNRQLAGDEDALINYYGIEAIRNPMDGPGVTIRKEVGAPKAWGDDVVAPLNGYMDSMINEGGGLQWHRRLETMPMLEVIVELPLHRKSDVEGISPFDIPLEIYWNGDKWTVKPGAGELKIKYKLHMVAIEQLLGETASHAYLLHRGLPIHDSLEKWLEINDARVREMQQEEAVKIMCGKRDSRIAGEMVFYRRVDE